MKKILLIEDDEMVRYALSRVLSAAGYQLTQAADGLQGVRAFRADTPDLVITDVVMPEEDGLGVLNALRKEDKTTPILVMSGGGEFGGFDYLTMAKGLGANAILAKPFDNASLLAEVARLIGA